MGRPRKFFGDGHGGGAGVWTDNGMDTVCVHETARFPQGNVRLARRIYGEALHGPAKDPAAQVNVFNCQVKGLLPAG